MSPTDPVSRLDLERLVLGRLDPTQQAALDARVAAEPELKARLDRIRADIGAAASDLPPLVLPAPGAGDTGLRLVEAPADASPAPARTGRRSWTWIAAGTALAAAAAGALVLVPGEQGGADLPLAETFRGSFDLEVHRVQAGKAEQVGAMVEVRAGDKLQYTLTSPEDGWWMVADVQDNGEVFMWTPPRRIQAGTPATAAVQLDDYTGAERAYFIVSEQPMELDVVREAYAAAYRQPLAELDTLPGIPGSQRSLLIVRSE